MYKRLDWLDSHNQNYRNAEEAAYRLSTEENLSKAGSTEHDIEEHSKRSDAS